MLEQPHQVNLGVFDSVNSDNLTGPDQPPCHQMIFSVVPKLDPLKGASIRRIFISHPTTADVSSVSDTVSAAEISEAD